MDRHYGLPVAFAAAAHAALLFAFDHSPRVVAPAQERTKFIDVVLEPVPPEPPLVIDRDADVRESAPPPPPSRPAAMEPVPIETNAIFKIDPPPLQPVSNIDVRKIEFPPLAGGGRDGPGWGPGGIIPGALLDNPPRTRFQASPIYPHEGKVEGLRGEVVVEFRVDENGRVHEPHVVSSTHRMFEEPTLRAVSRWQFEPGRRNGRVVSFKMAVPVVFNLND